MLVFRQDQVVSPWWEEQWDGKTNITTVSASRSPCYLWMQSACSGPGSDAATREGQWHMGTLSANQRAAVPCEVTDQSEAEVIPLWLSRDTILITGSKYDPCFASSGLGRQKQRGCRESRYCVSWRHHCVRGVRVRGVPVTAIIKTRYSWLSWPMISKR